MKQEAELDIESDTLAGRPLLRLRGLVDFRTSPRLREPLRRWVEEGVQAAVLNLKKLEKIDTTGVATIAETASDLRDRGGQLVLVNDSAAVRRALELSDMEDCCPRCNTEEEAARLLAERSSERDRP